MHQPIEGMLKECKAPLSSYLRSFMNLLAYATAKFAGFAVAGGRARIKHGRGGEGGGQGGGEAAGRKAVAARPVLS